MTLTDGSFCETKLKKRSVTLRNYCSYYFVTKIKQALNLSWTKNITLGSEEQYERGIGLEPYIS